MNSPVLLPTTLLLALMDWVASTVAPVAPLFQVTAPRVPLNIGLLTT